MKESINYYYNLNISEIENWDNVIRFKINNSYFYFVPFKRSEKEVEDLITISRELKSRGIEAHDIILNRFGEILTNVSNQNYCLLKPLGDIYEEYSLSTMLKINQSLNVTTAKKELYRNSWALLWSAKIDYFEYQIHELGQNKSIILNSFSYYIGLGENAISYVNNTTSKYQPTNQDKICLSHRRLNYPNYKLNYLNPLSFIFDLEIRDIAEYIKSAFFAHENALSYLKEVLRLKRFSIYSLELLYARLLYPTYYFDIYERIMNSEEEQEKLIPIIDLCDAYEDFLKEAHIEISKYAPITRIEWLLNKK